MCVQPLGFTEADLKNADFKLQAKRFKERW